MAKNGTVLDNPQGAAPTGIPIGSSNGFPKHASDTLSTIRLTNAPPSGFRGGGSFANDGRGGGQVLPGSTTDGTPITYREFDVYPFTPGVNRGLERIVLGSDGKAYYTSDHYATFAEMM